MSQVLKATRKPFITVGYTQADYICDGTADDVQVQAAVDDLIAGGGGTIFVKPGTYTFDTEVVILGSDIIIRGSGWKSTIFTLSDEVNREIFVVGNGFADGDGPRDDEGIIACHNVSFYDFALDGNKDNQTAATPAYPQRGTRNLLRYRSDAQTSYGGVIDGVHAYNGKQNGLSCESQQFMTIRNCRADENAQHGIWYENASNITITGNFTENNGLAGYKGLSFGDFSFIGNTSKSDNGAAFSFQTCARGMIVGNVAHRPGWHQDVGNTAADGFSFSSCTSISVSGNETFGCQGDGFQLNATVASTFVGNTFRSNGQFADDTYSDILLTNASGANNTDNIFANNTFRNTPFTNFPNSVKYNISANAQSHIRNTFANNLFGQPITAKTFNLASTDGTPGANDNSWEHNRGLNPHQYYKYGFLSSSHTLDPLVGDVIHGFGSSSTTTVSIANGIVRGQQFTFIFSQDSGNKAITWASNIKWSTGSPPILSSGANEYDVFIFTWDGTNWIGMPSSPSTSGKVGVGIKPVSQLHAYQDSTDTGTGAGLTIEQDGTGDAIAQFLLTGATRWALGADNSDNDSLKLAANADVGTNTIMHVTTAGNVGIGQTAPSSKFQVFGALATVFAAKTSSYSVTGADSVLSGDCTSGDLTFTLPSASTLGGREYHFKRLDASENSVIISADGSDTIDGSATKTLGSQWAELSIVCTGANWLIVSQIGTIT